MPRQIILEILEENEDFVSAEDLFMQVHERHPGIGLATVYRTLQLLVEIGVVSRIETGDGKGRFRLARQDERNRRAVLICTNCFKSIPLGSIENEEEELLEQLEDKIGAANEFSVRQSVLHFYGLCRECAQKPDAAAENDS